MKNFFQRHSCRLIHKAAFLGIFCITGIMAAAGCGHSEIESWAVCKGVQEGMKKASEIAEVSEKAAKLYALESFEKYLEGLYREGRQTELEIISTRLSLEEAALLAEKSPILEHIGMYAEGVVPLSTRGICILSADVNGDGMEDIIEYAPEEKSENEPNVLNIYLGMEDGSFRLSYAQHFFEIGEEWPNDIRIAKYEEETYLLFFNPTTYSYKRAKQYQNGAEQPEKKRKNRITAYLLSDGKITGRLGMDWECCGIEVKAAENMDAYEAHFLEEDRMMIYHVLNHNHCSLSYDWEWPRDGLCGSGEMRMDTEEQKEVCSILDDHYVEKYWEEQRIYEEKYAGKARSWIWIVYPFNTFESDINNDGIKEQYVRRSACLSLMGSERYSLMAPFITGEYQGIHEGRQGLVYYIESEGEETDFQKMCGLDIWEGEMTPQYFWVEATDRGNITYIAYQDGAEYRQRIEGYLIQGDQYERVVAVEYVPEMEFHAVYGEPDGLEGVDYIVHLSKDEMSFELEWDNQSDRGESLNQSIRKLLEDKVETMDLQGGEAICIYYEPVEAAEEKYIADCRFYYRLPEALQETEGEEDEITSEFRICVNILTGECTESELHN